MKIFKDTRRDYCGSYAFKMWLEHRICFTSVDNDTQRLLLDKAPFKQEIFFISLFIGYFA